LTAHVHSIIFRREYPQLKAVIQRSRELIGPRGRYNGQDKLWRLCEGRTIELGAVEHEWDVEKFQGRPHDLCAFNELAHFTQYQFRFLVARLGRSPDCGDAVVLANYQAAGTAGASPPRFLGGGAPLPSADRPQMPPLPGRVGAVMPPQGTPATRLGSTNRSTGGTPLPRLPPLPRRGPLG
jgi:hypothetical protein